MQSSKQPASQAALQVGCLTTADSLPGQAVAVGQHCYHVLENIIGDVVPQARECVCYCSVHPCFGAIGHKEDCMKVPQLSYCSQYLLQVGIIMAMACMCESFSNALIALQACLSCLKQLEMHRASSLASLSFKSIKINVTNSEM